MVLLSDRHPLRIRCCWRTTSTNRSFILARHRRILTPRRIHPRSWNSNWNERVPRNATTVISRKASPKVKLCPLPVVLPPKDKSHETETLRVECQPAFSKCYTLEILADLRIKQEPVALTDRERTEKLAERLSSDTSGRGFDSSSYGANSDHLPHGAQLGPAMVAIPPAHPPTSDQCSAAWNTKINRASTVCTVDGGE